jgi:hypothetical protein
VALSELEVVQGLEVELRALSYFAERDIVLVGLAVRGVRIGEVGQGGQQRVPLLVELIELWLELLQLGFELARGVAELLELRIVRLAGLRGLLDLARELVLIGADRVDAGVQLASPLVDSEQLIQLLRDPAPRQRRADGLRLAADLLEIERGSVPRARELPRTRRSSWGAPVPR